MSKKVSYTVKLNPSTIEELKLIAKQRGVKTSELVRGTLEDQVEISLRPLPFLEAMNKRSREFRNQIRYRNNG